MPVRRSRKPFPGPAGSRGSQGGDPHPLGARRDFRFAAGPVEWRLTAGEGLEDWLARFARVLELQPFSPSAAARFSGPRAVFLGLDPEPGREAAMRFPVSKLGADWPRSGWQGSWLNRVRLWTHPRVPDVVCEVVTRMTPESAVESMVMASFPFLRSVVEKGGLPLHTALVAREGFGVALVASAGTGKSTSSRRIPAPWRPLCDDTALILPRGPAGRKAYQAHPFATWSEYLWKRSEATWNVAGHVPLKAVFFLKQALKDKALPLGQGEAAVYLGQSANQVLRLFTQGFETQALRDFRSRVFDNACGLARAVPAFILETSLGGRFWEEVERALGPRRPAAGS